MAKFSVAVSSLAVFCAFACFPRFAHAWETLEPNAQILCIVGSIYLLVLTASGWLYLRDRYRVFGIIHTLLMFCAACFGFRYGILPLINHDYPVESLAVLLLIPYAAISLVAAICTVGMGRELYITKKKDGG
jgi:hypothetical protein